MKEPVVFAITVAVSLGIASVIWVGLDVIVQYPLAAVLGCFVLMIYLSTREGKGRKLWKQLKKLAHRPMK